MNQKFPRDNCKLNVHFVSYNKEGQGTSAEEKAKRKINVNRNVTELNLLQQSPKKRSIAASWFQNHYRSVVMQRLRSGQIFTSSPTKQQENRAWSGLRSKRRCQWFGSWIDAYKISTKHKGKDNMQSQMQTVHSLQFFCEIVQIVQIHRVLPLMTANVRRGRASGITSKQPPPPKQF